MLRFRKERKGSTSEHLESGERELILVAEDAEHLVPAEDPGMQVLRSMSKDLLEAFDDRIHRARERYKKAIRDVRTTGADLDRETAIAQAEICGTLHIIRRHNGGELPEGEYEAWWKEHACHEWD